MANFEPGDSYKKDSYKKKQCNRSFCFRHWVKVIVHIQNFDLNANDIMYSIWYVRCPWMAKSSCTIRAFKIFCLKFFFHTLNGWISLIILYIFLYLQRAELMNRCQGIIFWEFPYTSLVQNIKQFTVFWFRRHPNGLRFVNKERLLRIGL